MPIDQINPYLESAYGLLPLAKLISARADSAPEDSVIEAAGTEALRNRDLLKLSNHVGNTLKCAGFGASARIALTAEDGPEFAAAAVSIAAQATCVPLNPGMAPAVWKEMLVHLRIDAIVVPKDFVVARSAAKALELPVFTLSPAPDNGAGAFVLVGTDRKRQDQSTTQLPELDDVAFVLPTSGTTARPKAVPLTHRNIAHSGCNTGAALALTNEDRLIGVLPIHHAHGLISGLMATLYAGASVIVLRGFSAGSFFDHLARFRPTWLTAVPAIHQAILDAAPTHGSALKDHSLRLIRSASAPLPGPRFDALSTLFGVPVIETYGMTEAASQIASTSLECWRDKPGSVGKAAGPEIAIFDDEGIPQNVGAVGQIALRGSNMTLGYDDPAATASAFTNDGWFLTGDLGQLDADGSLFIVGRLKEIINRGGAKILPGRVESALTRHPAVAEAAAFGAPHARLGEEVAAAVVCAKGAKIDEAVLRQFAFDSGDLADTEVPRRIVFVDALPKTLTGKVQRALLADRLGFLRQAKEPASTATELQILDIWRDVMGRETISATDDFFHLGGDSLMAVEVALLMAERFNVALTLRTFFEAPTPRALAAVVRASEPETVAYQIKKAPVGAVQKLVSFSQERILSLESNLPGLPTHTVPIVYFIDGPFEPAVFQNALRILIARHEVFRSIYRKVAGQWVSTPTAAVNLRLEVEDWRWAGSLPHDGFLLDALENEVWDILDPTKSASLRTRILQLAEHRHALMLVFHHIAMDNWTIKAFIEEAFQHYGDLLLNRALAHPNPRHQFSDFAAWQLDWAKGQAAAQQRRYWIDRLSGLRTTFPVRKDSGVGFCTGRVNVALPKDTVDLLTARAKATGATLFMALIAAVKVFLHETFLQDDIAIVVPTANRSRPSTGDILGPVANNAAIRTKSAARGFGATLAAVRGAVLDADAHQELPFEIVMDDLLDADPTAAAALCDVYLSLVDSLEPDFEALGLNLSRMVEDQAFETPLPFGSTKLMFLLKMVDGAIVGTCVFKPHFFDHSAMEDLMAALTDKIPYMVEKMA